MFEQKFENSDVSGFDIFVNFVRNLEQINFPVDRFYSKNHTWIKFEGEIATVGINALIVFIFAPLIEIIPLSTPFFIKRNAPCLWIMHRDGVLTIRSPIQGELFEINETLLRSPDLLNKDPYFAGWLFKVKVVEVPSAPEILEQAEFLRYYRERLERFKKEVNLILSKSVSSSSATLQDGGRIVETVKDLLGARGYIALMNKIFEL